MINHFLLVVLILFSFSKDLYFLSFINLLIFYVKYKRRKMISGLICMFSFSIDLKFSFNY